MTSKSRDSLFLTGTSEPIKYEDADENDVCVGGKTR